MEFAAKDGEMSKMHNNENGVRYSPKIMTATSTEHSTPSS